jgi:hypothetical protein
MQHREANCQFRAKPLVAAYNVEPLPESGRSSPSGIFDAEGMRQMRCRTGDNVAPTRLCSIYRRTREVILYCLPDTRDGHQSGPNELLRLAGAQFTLCYQHCGAGVIRAQNETCQRQDQGRAPFCRGGPVNH